MRPTQRQSRRRTVVVALVLLAAGCAGTPAVSPALNAATIVMAPEDAPPGTEFNDSGEGPDAQTAVVISERSDDFLALPGYVEGQYRAFSGEGGAILAVALVFDTTEHAGGAYAAYLEELTADDGYGLESGTPTTWGDEGTCATGSVPTPLGEETICLWRTGTVVMAVGGAMEQEQLFTIAEDMNDRAG